MFSISECLTEKNIHYGGNEYTVALPRAETVESCRSACKYEGTDYFSFDTIMESCDCKSSTAGRKEDSHFVSGETSCEISSGMMNSNNHVALIEFDQSGFLAFLQDQSQKLLPDSEAPFLSRTSCSN